MNVIQISLKFLFLMSSWCYSQELVVYPPEKTYKTQLADLNRFADLKNPHFADGIPYSTGSREGKKLYNWQFPQEMKQDPDLGYLATPSAEIRHITRTDTEIVYDAIYTFDEHSRRVTLIKKTSSYNKFIALFGCSFTYGNGLNDNQTINYNIAAQNKEFYPYNYAIGGTGINSTLALVQRTDFSSQIPEKKGFFVEVYISAHVDRAAGVLPALQWLENTPYFVVTNDNKVERQGSFKTGRPIYNFTLQWINRLFGNNILSGRFFPSLNAKDYIYYCRLAEEVRDVLKQKSPGNEFVIYVHRSQPLDNGLRDCLNEKHITVLEPPGLNSEEYKIKIDGHPNAKMNELVAQDLLDFAHKKFATQN